MRIIQIPKKIWSATESRFTVFYLEKMCLFCNCAKQWSDGPETSLFSGYASLPFCQTFLRLLQVTPGWFHHDVNLPLQSWEERIKGKTKYRSSSVDRVLSFRVYWAPCRNEHFAKLWQPTALTALPLSSFQQKQSSGREEEKERSGYLEGCYYSMEPLGCQNWLW